MQNAVTAGDVLTLPELRELRRLSSARGAMLVLHAWGAIGAAMTLYALWPTWMTLVAAWVVIGSRQLGLFVLMHEAAHWLLFAQPAVNTWVGTWLCGAPVARDLKTYRRAHHLHHRHTLTADDPDLPLVSRFPMAWRTLAAAALCDVSGWTAVRAVFARRSWREVRGPLVANLVLLGIFVAAGAWQLYLLLWLLPLATWAQLVGRVREIAEHGAVANDGALRTTRTTATGWLARTFLAPYWVNYHLEHHLMVFVPCWKLTRAHALLRRKGYATRMELAPGYAAVLRRLTAV